MPPAHHAALSKLPALTFLFWVMKIAATTLGETAGDLLSMTLNVGYLVSTLILMSGFVVVLEQLPDNARFDREAREQLLDVFRDTADFWADRKIPFRCFYSFQ